MPSTPTLVYLCTAIPAPAEKTRNSLWSWRALRCKNGIDARGNDHLTTHSNLSRSD
jgi:hypothetical protein